MTKRPDASTLTVVKEVKNSLPYFRSLVPDDIKVSYELDQSPYVTSALTAVVREGLLGAVLTGLVVLLFLGDWRSSLIVMTTIPFALLTSVVALWLTGQTINIMTLGGLALAVGILVDEGVVEIENIDSTLQQEPEFAGRARRAACHAENGVAALPVDAFGGGGFCSFVPDDGRGAKLVRAALAGGCVRDGRFVPALELLPAGAVSVDPSPDRSRAQGAHRGTMGLRQGARPLGSVSRTSSRHSLAGALEHTSLSCCLSCCCSGRASARNCFPTSARLNSVCGSTLPSERARRKPSNW